MNVAVRVATQNAINTSLMAANSAARRNRQNGGGDIEIGPIGFAFLCFLAVVAIVVVTFMFWEVINL